MPYVAYFATVSAPGTGVLTATEAADTLVASGLISAPRASLIVTESADTLVSVGDVPIQWSTTDKSAAYTLSNNNLTATNLTGPPATSGTILRATTSRSAGKKYFEIWSDCNHVSQSGRAGVAESTESLSNPLGKTSSYGYETSGLTWHNNTSSNSYAAWVSDAPAYLAFAIDFDAGKMWFGKQIAGPPGITWNGDPVAGTSPAYTFTANTALFPAWGGNNNPDYGILVTTTPSFHSAPPSGFTCWAS